MKSETKQIIKKILWGVLVLAVVLCVREWSMYRVTTPTVWIERDAIVIKTSPDRVLYWGGESDAEVLWSAVEGVFFRTQKVNMNSMSIQKEELYDGIKVIRNSKVTWEIEIQGERWGMIDRWYKENEDDVVNLVASQPDVLVLRDARTKDEWWQSPKQGIVHMGESYVSAKTKRRARMGRLWLVSPRDNGGVMLQAEGDGWKVRRR